MHSFIHQSNPLNIMPFLKMILAPLSFKKIKNILPPVVEGYNFSSRAYFFKTPFLPLMP